MRYAAIDIGSNAVRLLIADVQTNEGDTLFHKTLFLRVPLRLGTSAFTENKINDARREALVKTMTAFGHLIDVYEVKSYMACATAAMREAANGLEIRDYVAQHTPINIEIIDGKKEANLIHNINVAQTIENVTSHLYIDVGGGSTELTLFNNKKIATNYANFTNQFVKLM